MKRLVLFVLVVLSLCDVTVAFSENFLSARPSELLVGEWRDATSDWLPNPKDEISRMYFTPVDEKTGKGFYVVKFSEKMTKIHHYSILKENIKTGSIEIMPLLIGRKGNPLPMHFQFHKEADRMTGSVSWPKTDHLPANTTTVNHLRVSTDIPPEILEKIKTLEKN